MSVKTKNYRKHEMSHSQKRGFERYGICLSKKDLAAIVKIVLGPNRDSKVFLHQQGDGCSHWIVSYLDELYRIVFDERTQTTRTFLDIRPVDRELWRSTHDRAGHPTLGDVVRISKLRLK